MQRRRRAREVALQVLYGLDVAEKSVDEAIRLFWEIYKAPDEPESEILFSDKVKSFAVHLVNGTWQNREAIDTLISRSSEHWSIGRMPRVDRCILRMAIYELLYCEDIPPKVSLNEAIDLGKTYGSENSGSFINGILDAVYANFNRDGQLQTTS
ncbi:MAG: transcription antitermination factor NusB [Syntrophales bacterium]|nr:transcription antitermination factor NusB [Syntrophales bacterium]